MPESAGRRREDAAGTLGGERGSVPGQVDHDQAGELEHGCEMPSDAAVVGQEFLLVQAVVGVLDGAGPVHMRADFVPEGIALGLEHTRVDDLRPDHTDLVEKREDGLGLRKTKGKFDLLERDHFLVSASPLGLVVAFADLDYWIAIPALFEDQADEQTQSSGFAHGYSLLVVNFPPETKGCCVIQT